jgi:ribosomal protein S12 methylthiotransferase
MKICLITLGCPKNVVDSEYLQGSLANSQVEFISQPEEAEVIIINTCGFIQSAKEEAIDTILEAAQFKKSGICRQLLVTGCLVNRYQPELIAQLPEVDGFYSSRDLPGMILQIGKKLAVPCQMPQRALLTPPHFAYLKIAEGCTNCCSYCAIPLIRGPQISRNEDEIIAEARELVENGARELILIAQDITNYGADLASRGALTKLIKKIVKIDSLKWLRLMYAHPAHVTDELIDLIGSEAKICKYLDLPIQHISDKLLQRMGRKVNRGQIEGIIQKLRDRVPEIALRTSVIAGFPGETEADFDELIDFISATRFERLGAFAYSAEEGTPAFHFKNRVDAATKQSRLETIMEIQAELSLNRNLTLVGSKLEVLIDEFDSSLNQFMARTQWDAPEVDNLIWLTTNDVAIGEYREIIVNQAFEFDLIGSVQ